MLELESVFTESIQKQSEIWMKEMSNHETQYHYTNPPENMLLRLNTCSKFEKVGSYVTRFDRTYLGSELECYQAKNVLHLHRHVVARQRHVPPATCQHVGGFDAEPFSQ